jgi:DNA-3-methyladenine glycosylase II
VKKILFAAPFGFGFLPVLAFQSNFIYNTIKILGRPNGIPDAAIYTEGTAMLFFQYGKMEIDYLKSRDKILGDAIDRIGHIKRTIDTGVFSSIIHHIIGQQISTAAQKTIWERMNSELGNITEDTIYNLSVEGIQNFGMTFRKAEYIRDIARKVKNGELNINGLKNKPDNEVIKELSSLRGIGQWTAEMIMIFCFQRPDILSYNDLAIHRGMRMLYHHRNINKKIFEKYRRRYSPCCTVASLYLWSIASGTIEGMKDYLPKKKKGSEMTGGKKTAGPVEK